MKCGYCGAELTREERFCLTCGTRREDGHEKEKYPAAVAAEPEWGISPEMTTMELITEPENWLPNPESITFAPSALKLPEERGLGKMVFLGILTLGIYPTVIWSRMVTELNIVASRADGKRTMPYFAMLLLLPLTLGIFPLVWMHKFCSRIGNELARRGLDCRFGPRDFWLWSVLGILILVGPFVFIHKLCRAMNQINTSFNING